MLSFLNLPVIALVTIISIVMYKILVELGQHKNAIISLRKELGSVQNIIQLQLSHSEYDSESEVDLDEDDVTDEEPVAKSTGPPEQKKDTPKEVKSTQNDTKEVEGKNTSENSAKDPVAERVDPSEKNETPLEVDVDQEGCSESE